MTIIKYRSEWPGIIEPVECLEEDAHFVWIPDDNGTPYKVTKCGPTRQYHDTWEDAHDYLMQWAEGRLGTARQALAMAQQFMDTVIELRKPEETP